MICFGFNILVVNIKSQPKVSKIFKRHINLHLLQFIFQNKSNIFAHPENSLQSVFIYRDNYSTFPRNDNQRLNCCNLTAVTDYITCHGCNQQL